MWCSARLQGNPNQNVDNYRQFWENVHNPLEIERKRSHGRVEAVAAEHSMTTNNLDMFQEETQTGNRENASLHTTPDLPDVTPITDATVNSLPDVETFRQELTNYSEEVSSQWIPPMVYINGSNHRSQQTRVSSNEEHSKNSQNSVSPTIEQEQTNKEGPLSWRYTEPSLQGAVTVNLPMLQKYWDEDFSNITSIQHGINSLSFCTLAANINLQSLTTRSQPDWLENPVMDKIVPVLQNILIPCKILAMTLISQKKMSPPHRWNITFYWDIILKTDLCIFFNLKS